MSKPGKVLRTLCKKLGVRLTVKRGQKRVYKSVKVLKAQCKRKVKKKVKRKRRFGTKKSRVDNEIDINSPQNKVWLSRGGNTITTQTRPNQQPAGLRGNIMSFFIGSGKRRFYGRMQRLNTVRLGIMREMKRLIRNYNRYDNVLDLRGKRFIGFDFNDTNLQRVNLSLNDHGIVTVMRNCSFNGTDFKGANLERASFSRSYFGDRGTDFSTESTNGTHAKFEFCYIQGIDLSNASFQHSVWDRCYFRPLNDNPGSINFIGTDLRHSTFTNAFFKHADFESADLRGANFEGARIIGCDFTNADLRGANFSIAQPVIGCRFDDAKYDNTTQFTMHFDPDEWRMTLVDDVGENEFGKKRKRKVKKKVKRKRKKVKRKRKKVKRKRNKRKKRT